MKKSALLVLFTVGCAGGKSCPDGRYLSASGDCEERQEGGSPAPDGGGNGGGSGGGDDTGVIDTGGGDDTGGGGGDEPSQISVDHNESGVRLTLQPSGYWGFGMAETSGSSSDPWTGEDCYYGYYDGDGYYYQYCHVFEGDGVVLPGVESFEDLSTESTLFGNVDPSATTYVLINYDTYACYTWGDDTSYYYGCSVVSAD